MKISVIFLSLLSAIPASASNETYTCWANQTQIAPTVINHINVEAFDVTIDDAPVVPKVIKATDSTFSNAGIAVSGWKFKYVEGLHSPQLRSLNGYYGIKATFYDDLSKYDPLATTVDFTEVQAMAPAKSAGLQTLIRQESGDLKLTCNRK